MCKHRNDEQPRCLRFQGVFVAMKPILGLCTFLVRCSSRVGRIGGRQEISVGTSNGSVTCGHGEIVHQIGHAVGFFHEHTRPDRDEYVTVHWNNIMSGEYRRLANNPMLITKAPAAGKVILDTYKTKINLMHGKIIAS